MADINISADFSQVNAATKAVENLEKKVSANTRVLKAMAMADIQAAREQRVLNEALNNMNPALDQLSRKMRQQQGLLNQMSSATQKTTGVFGRFGFAAQQAGYQVGDFFVQVQSGTNPLVAFGQQATQLAGLLTLSLNPAIMAWGVGLSVVIPLITALGATWMRTKEKAEDYKDPLKEALDLTKKLREETDKIRFPDQTTKVVDDLKQKVKEAADEVERLQRLQVTAPPSSFGAAIGLALGQKASEEALKIAEESLNALQEELHWHDLIIQRENAKNAEAKAYLAGLQEQKKYIAEQYEYMGKTRSESDNFKNALVAAYQVLAQSKTAAGLLADNLARASKETWMLATVGGYTVRESYGPMMMGRGQPATGTPQKHLSTQQLSDAYGLYGFTRNLNTQPTTTTTGGGGGTSGQTFEEYIKGLEEEVAIQEKLVGLHGLSAEIEKARADAAKALNKSLDQLTPKELERVDSLTKQNYLIEQQRQLVDNAYNSINDALLSMVDGSKSVSKAFKDMMTSILKSIYEQMVTNPIANAGSNLFSTFLSSMSGIPIGSTPANGNVFNAGNLQAFATGGVVGSPTLFPMAGGKTGLMGEAGPEAIMPLKRGPDGRLGVVSSGGGSVTVNNVINVTGTGDAAYVRGEVTKMLPQITGATKAAVIDARKRGGQMAAAFR